MFPLESDPKSLTGQIVAQVDRKPDFPENGRILAPNQIWGQVLVKKNLKRAPFGGVFPAMWLSENDLKFFPVKWRQRRVFRTLAVPRLYGRVADLGAGSGPYQRELRGCTVIGLDCQPSPAVQVLGSALALPFKPASFDGVLLTEVLEHVSDPLEALKEAGRILKTGGLLYLTSPQMWPLHYEPHDYYRFTGYGLSNLVEEAGLLELACQPLGGLYTFLLTRLGEKLVKIIGALFGWLPQPHRFQVVTILTWPWLWCLAWLGGLLDRLTPRDVLGWALLAQKPSDP